MFYVPKLFEEFFGSYPPARDSMTRARSRRAEQYVTDYFSTL